MGSEIANNFSKVRSNYALNLAPASNEATIDIFGIIGVWWDGVEAQQFIDEIKALDVDKLTINISSPGGFVSDGLMIYDAIRSHKAFVTARLSGLVASMATVIACAADEVIASDTLMYMIHNIQGGAMGTPSDMRKAADVFEKQEGVLVNLYRKKTGQTKSQIQKWIDAETWFTLDEAIAEGFVDKKGEGFNFDYESNAQDTDTRDFMASALNCANLPDLQETTDKRQNDNNTMSEFSKEQQGFLERLFGTNKTKDTAPKTDAKNELEELRNQVADLTNKLEATNKTTEATNFDTLISGLTNALKPQLAAVATEAANTAVEAVKADLEAVTKTVNEVTEKVESTETVDAINARVDELAKGVNTTKSLAPQPETKKDNGEGLETVVVVEPTNTFKSLVSDRLKK